MVMIMMMIMTIAMSMVMIMVNIAPAIKEILLRRIIKGLKLIRSIRCKLSGILFRKAQKAVKWAAATCKTRDFNTTTIKVTSNG